jgi:hypothetical protein
MNLLNAIETEVDNGSSATDVNSGKPRLLYLVTRAERGGAQTHVLDLACSMRPDFEPSPFTYCPICSGKSGQLGTLELSGRFGN